MRIKTIDITAKEWFDKQNGNSYFSARIALNFGTKTEKNFKIGFNYGYDDHYINVSSDFLKKQGYINPNEKELLWHYCGDHKIILRTTKIENCLKRDMIAWGN